MYYFFLKPLGHLGETPVTFLVVFPFVQVMVVLFTTGLGDGAGALSTLGSSGFATIFTGRISLYAGVA